MKKLLYGLLAVLLAILPLSVDAERNLDLPKIFLEHGVDADGLLKADVRIENAQEGLMGAAFHLEYDPRILEYVNYEEGDFFEKLTKPLYLVKNKPGKVIFGASLTRGYGLVQGEGRLLTVYFRQIAQGSMKFSFSNTNLAGFEGQRVDKQGEWFGKELEASLLGAEDGWLTFWLLIGVIVVLCAAGATYLFYKGMRI